MGRKKETGGKEAGKEVGSPGEDRCVEERGKRERQEVDRAFIAVSQSGGRSCTPLMLGTPMPTILRHQQMQGCCTLHNTRLYNYASRPTRPNWPPAEIPRNRGRPTRSPRLSAFALYCPEVFTSIPLLPRYSSCFSSCFSSSSSSSAPLLLSSSSYLQSPSP